MRPLGVHTVARWRRQKNWDSLKQRVVKRAAELFSQRVGMNVKQMNAHHRQIWGFILCQAGILLARPDVSPQECSELERIVTSALRGVALTRSAGRQAS